jgi:hypothetical protein
MMLKRHELGRAEVANYAKENNVDPAHLQAMAADFLKEIGVANDADHARKQQVVAG